MSKIYLGLKPSVTFRLITKKKSSHTAIQKARCREEEYYFKL